MDILSAAGETLEAATLRECLTSAGVNTLPHLGVQIIDTRAVSAVCPSFTELCGMANTVEQDLRQVRGLEEVRVHCEEDHTFHIQGFMTQGGGLPWQPSRAPTEDDEGKVPEAPEEIFTPIPNFTEGIAIV